MEGIYLFITLAVVLVLTFTIVWLRLKGKGYDHLLLLAALVAGFVAADLFRVTQWYYWLPLMGITVPAALLLLAFIVFLFGTQPRRAK